MFVTKILLMVCAVFIGAANIAAQSSQPCPVVAVEAVDKVDPGTPVVFTVRLKPSVAIESLKYKWQISAGTIIGGENTSSITVDVVGLSGQSVTATVQIPGNVDSCSASKTVDVIQLTPACGLPLDQYGDIRFAWEKARLDNFAIQLMNQVDARGAIVTFAGRQTYKGEAAERLRRAKNYLVRVRNIPATRVLTIDAGYRTDLTTYLVIVPAGATVPTAESFGTFSIPIQEVQFTKRRPNANNRPKRE